MIFPGQEPPQMTDFKAQRLEKLHSMQIALNKRIKCQQSCLQETEPLRATQVSAPFGAGSVLFL